LGEPVAPPGRCPERKGVDRVRALYHYPGATIVYRRRSCARPRHRHAKTSGGRWLRRPVVVGRPADRPVHASAEQIRPIRDRAADELGGIGSPIVEEWEIAVLHRDHRSGEGACARATWVKLPPEQLDQGIEFYKASVLPELEALDGFCSASLLVDRASGRAVTCASFDSLEAMERSREQGTALKQAKTREAGADELDDCEFELRLAHLRAPELV
jgi:hypothetical protein